MGCGGGDAKSVPVDLMESTYVNWVQVRGEQLKFLLPLDKTYQD